MTLGRNRHAYANLFRHRHGQEIDVQDRVLGRVALNLARQHMQQCLTGHHHLDRPAACLMQRDAEQLPVHRHCDRFLALTINDTGHSPSLACFSIAVAAGLCGVASILTFSICPRSP